MRELVSQHALDLVGRELSEQALGHRNRRVLGVAPGRERVGLVGRDQVQARDRHVRTLRQEARDLLELGDLASLERPGPAGLQRELVGEPVAGDVHQHGKRDEQPECASADGAADRDQQRGQAGDQQPGSNLGSETSRCDVHGLESPFD